MNDHARQTVRRGSDSGFTLLELLLAIGVLTFVSVAISAIFGTIGDTVNRGKRISELNQFASRIESVMRQDFANMSRDGFLVIRHEYAASGFPQSPLPNAPPQGSVPLFEGDPNPRPRRVDQIMFFATGEYTSARPDIYAGLNASSNEARIYYGHGQKRTPDFSNGSPYLEPDLRDDLVGQRDFQFRDAAARLGTPSTPGLPNPNEYASDWTLLRHVTLLKPPAPQLAQLLPDYADGGLYGYTADRELVNISNRETESAIQRKVVTDRQYQVALQPAIPSIFWNSQAYQFGGNPNDLAYVEAVANPVWVGYGPAELREARFSSGLVDIATTSLAEIESYVTSANFLINADNLGITNRNRFFFVLGFKFPEEAKINPNGGPSIQNFPNRYPYAFTSPGEQRAWMINALPVHPAEPSRDLFGNDYEVFDRTRGISYTGPTSPRIRYEELPPNLAGTLTDAGGNQGNARDRLVNAYRSADQEMLTRSIFVPRCTEFIVEWTFGEVFDDYSSELGRSFPELDRAELVDSFADLGSDASTDPRWKKFVWYGRDRWQYDAEGNQIDLDGDGRTNFDPNDRSAYFYTRNADERDGQLRWVVQVEDAMKRHNSNAESEPRVTQYTEQDFAINMARARAKNPEHIVGRLPGRRPDDSQANGRRIPETATFGYYVYDPGVNSNYPEDDLVMNWPWPKLIRITFGLADPNNPGIETTYQVVFEVPSRDAD